MQLPAIQAIEKKIRFLESKRKTLRLDDEFRFIRSWIAKPLTVGAVTPSGRALALTMAAYVDPGATGPVVELGPGTGPITQALIERGVDPKRLVLVEFSPTFCHLLRQRFPQARVIQGDAYSLRRILSHELSGPAAAIVSGLPLFNKPLKTRLRMIREAFTLMRPSAPFVQFTYAAVGPIPKGFDGITAEPCDRVWMNIPPARVWVYRKA